MSTYTLTEIEPPTTFYEFTLPPGTVEIRDIVPGDVERFVRYWHDSGDEHLRYLNIDREALGTREDTEARFLSFMRTGDADQREIGFSLILNGEAGGYFNLNRYSALENYPHFHVLDQEHRALGGASAMMPYGFKMLFDLFPIERMVLQTRTRVVAINKLLDHFLPVVETVHLENPDGIAGPGEFHHRYIYRRDVPEFIAKCDELRRQIFGDTQVVAVADELRQSRT